MALSAFFSSSEAAFLSLQRTRIAHLVSTGAAGASRVAQMMDQPERMLSTILLGNNLVNVAFAALITIITLSFLDERVGVAVATAVATSLLLIFGEVVPKTIAVRHSERVAFLYARPLKWIEALLWPFVIVLRWDQLSVWRGRRRRQEIHHRSRAAHSNRGRRGGRSLRAGGGGDAGERLPIWETARSGRS